MKIDVEAIKDTLGAIEQIDLSVPFEDREIQGREVNFIENISLTGQVINSDEDYIIAANANTKIKVACSRCLEEFDMVLDFEFNVDFPKEDIENDELDLDQPLEDNITLAIPMQTICDEECKGLCPNCGIDLNKEECNCFIHEVDPRLAKLEKLLDKD